MKLLSTKTITNRRIIKMKKLITIILCIGLLMTMFTGCTSEPTSSTKSTSSTTTTSKVSEPTSSTKSKVSEKKIPILIGEWKQSNSKSEDAYQLATITDTTIEIYHVRDNGDTKSLYWAGTFIAPKTADDPYVWDSKNDHSKTENSILGSNDDTKTMTYENGTISYKLSIMGTTTTIKLKKQK